MKKALILLLAIFTFNNSHAQDTILKLDGDTIFAKISEVTPSEIKYKKLNYLNGPNYIESKSNIKMIKFSNGIKEVYSQEQPNIATNINPNEYNTTEPIKSNNKIETFGINYKYQRLIISEKDMQKIVLGSGNKQAIDLIGKAKKAQKIQYITGFSAIPLSFVPAILVSGDMFWYNEDLFIGVALTSIASAVTCTTISIFSKRKRTKLNRQAAKIYNEKF